MATPEIGCLKSIGSGMVSRWFRGSVETGERSQQFRPVWWRNHLERQAGRSSHVRRTPDRIRVLAVARTQLLRAGLSALVCSQPDMELAGSAATADRAVQLFLKSSPDVTLLDVDLPDFSGIEAIRRILAVNPGACIIGLLTNEWDEVGRAAIAAGAWSCVSKDRLTEDLPAMIQRSCGRNP
jgi:CheY-like chemotaxis protein